MPAQTTQTENSRHTPVDRLRQEFERFLENALSQGERAMDFIGLKDFARPAVLAADILETPEQLQVLVDIPGVDPQMLEITLVGNMLTLRVNRPAATAAAEQILHRNERASGPLTRSLPLPVPVDPNKVSAEAKQGVLVITLPKEEKSKPRHIRVQVEQSGEAAGVIGSTDSVVRV